MAIFVSRPPAQVEASRSVTAGHVRSRGSGPWKCGPGRSRPVASLRMGRGPSHRSPLGRPRRPRCARRSRRPQHARPCRGRSRHARRLVTSGHVATDGSRPSDRRSAARGGRSVHGAVIASNVPARTYWRRSSSPPPVGGDRRRLGSAHACRTHGTVAGSHRARRDRFYRCESRYVNVFAPRPGVAAALNQIV